MEPRGNKRASLLVLAAAVGLAYLVLAGGADKRMARTKSLDANEALAYGDAQQALLLLQDAMQLDPDSAEYHAQFAAICSNYRHEAARLFNLTLPEVYGRILAESRAARALRPQDVEMARQYAYFVLEAERYGIGVNWTTASEAWRRYLATHRRHPAPDPSGMLTPATTFRILVRLAKIEDARGRRAEAERYLHEADGFTGTKELASIHGSAYYKDYLQREEKEENTHASTP